MAIPNYDERQWHSLSQNAQFESGARSLTADRLGESASSSPLHSQISNRNQPAARTSNLCRLEIGRRCRRISLRAACTELKEEVTQMSWIYSLAVLGLGGGSVVGVKQYLNWRERRDEASMLRFRCPRCEQKLRYGASRAGQTIACPGCHRRITLPSQPAPVVPSQRRIGQRITAVRT